jgi:hypothetical protein
MPRQTELERRIAAIDQLVRSLENGSDPATRAAAQELAGTLMELHATALERMLDAVRRHGEAGRLILEQLARDDVISGVLLLHDLHPVDLPTRVLGALEKTRRISSPTAETSSWSASTSPASCGSGFRAAVMGVRRRP